MGNETQTWPLLREKGRAPTSLGSAVCAWTRALEPGPLRASRKHMKPPPKTPFHFPFAGKRPAHTGQLSKILRDSVYSPTFTGCRPPSAAVSEGASSGFMHVPLETCMPRRVTFTFSYKRRRCLCSVTVYWNTPQRAKIQA